MFAGGCYQAKFSEVSGFHKIAFCSLVKSDGMAIGSLGHIQYLHKVESELLDMQTIMICDGEQKCALM